MRIVLASLVWCWCALAPTASHAAKPVAAPGFAPLRVQAAYGYSTAAPGITGVAYMSIVSTKADTLLRAASPWASAVEIHEMRNDNGMMRMRALRDGLVVPANTPTTLAPGGVHLMLFNPPQALRVGDKLPLDLTFARAGRVRVMVDIRARQ